MIRVRIARTDYGGPVTAWNVGGMDDSAGAEPGERPRLPRGLVRAKVTDGSYVSLRECDERGAAEIVIQRRDGTCEVVPLSPRKVRVWTAKLSTIIARVD